uniref:Aa_trans domain-containing protein n=1 Tax=Heterorhabditis bacteriophora TaxID=37862 RepID=A0A1I7XEC5_HETBA
MNFFYSVLLATTFGIALPKWLVSKEYGVWVLAFYGLLFMVVLPVAVGIWWYNSIKYNVDKVLLDTTQLFYYFLHKTPKMEINRLCWLIYIYLVGTFTFNISFFTQVYVQIKVLPTCFPILYI